MYLRRESTLGILYLDVMNKCLLLLVVCICFVSCNSNKPHYITDLQETNTRVTYVLSENTTSYIKSLSIFEEQDGKGHLVMASNNAPEIYVYDMSSQKLEKTIVYQREGADGVGPKVGGVLMVNWDCIYLPSLFVPEISQIDSAGHRKKVIPFISDDEGYPFIMTRSVTGAPMYLIEDELYCIQMVNPRLGKDMVTDSSVGMKINLKTGGAEAFDFCYPSKLSPSYNSPSLGIETKVSRCYNGRDFIYSFAFDEDLYLVSKDHKQVRRIPARSRYIDELNIPDKIPSDFKLATKQMCEQPFYGDIIYDKYREVYYRIVYPRENLSLDESFSDLWQSGRSRFSIIILDKDFHIIGETLFPENHYRSDLYYVTSEGLFISDSHYKKPDNDEDVLSFRLFMIGASN